MRFFSTSEFVIFFICSHEYELPVVVSTSVNTEAISLRILRRAPSPLPLFHLPDIHIKNRIGQICPTRFATGYDPLAGCPLIFKVQSRRRNDGVLITECPKFSVMS